jgi:hypothetical protein
MSSKAGVRFQVWTGISVFSTTSRWDLELISSPVHCIQLVVSPGIKRSEREADHISIKKPCAVCWPITLASRSKAWTAFALSKTGVGGSNPTQNVNVCVRLFHVCTVLCAGSGLASGWSPGPRSPTDCVKRSRNWKSGQGPTKDYRAIDR